MEKILYAIFWLWIGMFLISFGEHSLILLFGAGLWILGSCVWLIRAYMEREW